MADADPLALDAPLLQQGLSLGRGEDLAGAVDPAAGDTEAVRGVHQVAERERAVLHGCERGGICQHDADGRRAVERVSVRRMR